MEAKEELLRILEFYKYLLDNDKCKMAEIESVSRVLMENMAVSGTVEDFAKYFGTSESNIRSLINRKLIAKPTRRVFYPFHAFLKIVPEKLRKKK